MTKRIKCQHPPLHLRLLPHAHCAHCGARVTQPTWAYRKAEAERIRKAYQASYKPDNFKEVFEDREGGAEEYGVFEKETK